MEGENFVLSSGQGPALAMLSSAKCGQLSRMSSCALSASVPELVVIALVKSTAHFLKRRIDDVKQDDQGAAIPHLRAFDIPEGDANGLQG